VKKKAVRPQLCLLSHRLSRRTRGRRVYSQDGKISFPEIFWLQSDDGRVDASADRMLRLRQVITPFLPISKMKFTKASASKRPSFL
jgi:hypothetical protein